MTTASAGQSPRPIYSAGWRGKQGVVSTGSIIAVVLYAYRGLMAAEDFKKLGYQESNRHCEESNKPNT